MPRRSNLSKVMKKSRAEQNKLVYFFMPRRSNLSKVKGTTLSLNKSLTASDKVSGGLGQSVRSPRNNRPAPSDRVSEAPLDNLGL